MIALAPKTTASLSFAALLFTASCASVYNVPIEMSLQPTMDVSSFRRVLVPGFVAGGLEEIDADVETTRLLRGQLRMHSSLRVIDADPIRLMELAAPEHAVVHPGQAAEGGSLPHIFAQAAFWRRLGEEYQEPLIITGTVLFRQESRTEPVRTEQESFDATGRRSVRQAWKWQQVYDLLTTFVFIDGRTGNVIKIETYREELSTELAQSVPALSAYFELMDRVVPGVLRVVSGQHVRAFRFLLK